MLNETWADQHARLLRSHRRLQSALSRRSEAADPNYDALDALYHFCCDALHLRDWITVDLPQHARAVSALINNSRALAACADIAIGSKHAECTRTIRTSGGPAKVAQRGTTISPGSAWLSTTGDPPPPNYPTVGTTQTTFKIDAGAHGEYDALDLATQAVKEWETWLRARGLL